MPISKTYKCGSCNDTILKTQGSIMCNSCKLWLHFNCANVSKDHLVLFKDKQSSFSFTCPACLNAANDHGSLRDENDRDSYKNSLAEIMSQFKDEMLASNRQLKDDILKCMGCLLGWITLHHASFLCVPLFGIDITDQDINQTCYMSNQKLIPVKFNCVSIRDRLMKDYFKTRSLKVIVESSLMTTPASSALSAVCRKLKRHKSITKFTMLNTGSSEVD
ncbi:hypothetical protein CVS40_12961 [Lucilia cuprina]|nr:hypothetical protein CVS40_12961 [Lucilia cuprina]